MDEGVTMLLRHRLCLGTTILGLSSASVLADPAKPPEALVVSGPAKPAAVPAGPMVVGTVAPFGFYQTQWRAFPTAPTPPSKPAETPIPLNPPTAKREP